MFPLEVESINTPIFFFVGEIEKIVKKFAHKKA